MFAVGFRDREIAVEIWSLEANERIAELSNHGASISSLAFSPDGMYLATGSGRRVQLWEIEPQALIVEFAGHAAGILGVAFSNDGRWLYSGSADGCIRKAVSKPDVLLVMSCGNVRGHTQAISICDQIPTAYVE